MNTEDILLQISKKADSCLGDVLEKVLLNLRYHHTHQCWRKECCCEYCQFINGKYVESKMILRNLKHRLNRYDNTWELPDDAMDVMTDLVERVEKQKLAVKQLKEYKKSMQKEIL